ncbi:3950_t:CDS:2, partial [Ambispora gerdemannii]
MEKCTYYNGDPIPYNFQSAGGSWVKMPDVEELFDKYPGMTVNLYHVTVQGKVKGVHDTPMTDNDIKEIKAIGRELGDKFYTKKELKEWCFIAYQSQKKPKVNKFTQTELITKEDKESQTELDSEEEATDSSWEEEVESSPEEQTIHQLLKDNNIKTNSAEARKAFQHKLEQAIKELTQKKAEIADFFDKFLGRNRKQKEEGKSESELSLSKLNTDLDERLKKYKKEPERESKPRTLQELLDKERSNKKYLKKIIFNQENSEKELDGGELTIQDYPNLEVVTIDGECLKSKLTKLEIKNCPNLACLKSYNNNLTSLDVSECINLKTLALFFNQITSLDVSNNPKLTDLFCDAELSTENKIVGLEKTSIIRKYNTTFPEMKLLDISDLNILAQQVNKETVNNEEFLKQLCNEKALKGKDEEYEKNLEELAKSLHCMSMNPKNPVASIYQNREKLVQQALTGDKTLLAKIADLPYIS